MFFILDLGRNFWDFFPQTFLTFRVLIKPVEKVVFELLYLVTYFVKDFYI